MMEYYLLLSQDHPELSLIEAMFMVRSIGDVIISHSEPGLLILRTGRDIGGQLLKPSFIKEFGLVIRRAGFRGGSGEIYREIFSAVKAIPSQCHGKIGLRIYNLGRKRAELDYKLILRYLETKIGSLSSNTGPRDLMGLSCNVTIIVGGILLIATPIARRASRDRGEMIGYMKDTDILFLANIATYLGAPGRVVYDPFGGYGRILEKICTHKRSLIVGSDIDAKRAMHMKQALGSLDKPCLSEVIVADALTPPMRPGCVDLVVSDLPYGKRSRSIGEDYLNMPTRFLQSMKKILPEGSTILISISLEQLRRAKDILLGGEDYRILSIAPQYIHGSLTRVYLLLSAVPHNVSEETRGGITSREDPQLHRSEKRPEDKDLANVTLINPESRSDLR